MKRASAAALLALLAPIRAIHVRMGARNFAWVLLYALGTGLAGCFAPGNLPPREYYVLDDLSKAAAPKRATATGRVLLVNPTSVSPFYDTQSLVFSRAPGQRAHYQFAAWTERPGRRFSELLMRRLDARGGFKSVTSTTSGVKGDLVLNTRLEEFYQDAGTDPGSARIELSVELIDHARRAILARRAFSQSAPAGVEGAPAAVAAFNRAMTALLDEVTVWLEQEAARPEPR